MNIYRAQPGRQDEVLALLERAADEVMRFLPGFLNASFYKGRDGISVGAYAEWESVEAWRAMTSEPDILRALKPVMTIAACEPMLFDPMSEFSV